MRVLFILFSMQTNDVSSFVQLNVPTLWLSSDCTTSGIFYESIVNLARLGWLESNLLNLLHVLLINA